MRWNSGSRQPVLAVGLLGAAALVLRWFLYAAAVDGKGLLVRWHPVEMGLAAVSLAAAAVIFLGAWKQDTSGSRKTCAGGNWLGAVGNLAAGAGILATVLTAGPGMGNYLETGWRILGLLAPLCLLAAGIAQVFGKKPFFLLHVVVCLFFVLHIVTRYQLWSGNPQMQDYVFSLLGAMALMFFSFYTAAWEADCGNNRMQLGMGLAAIYLCLAELARSSCPGLYLGGLLWILGSFFSTEAIEKEEK